MKRKVIAWFLTIVMIATFIPMISYGADNQQAMESVAEVETETDSELDENADVIVDENDSASDVVETPDAEIQEEQPDDSTLQEEPADTKYYSEKREIKSNAGSLKAGAPSAKVVYDGNGTLTFYYDSLSHDDSGYSVYAYPSEDPQSNTDVPWQDIRYVVQKVVIDSSFKDYRPTTAARIFNNLQKCTSFVGLNYFNTSNVKSMKSMFYSCDSLTSLDLSGFDTSNVENMANMFQYCEKLKTLNISSFNTSKVTDMSSMFEECAIETIEIGNIDTSNVTNMNRMFENCGMIPSVVATFDTAKVENFSDMFSHARYDGEVLDISSFDTSSATNMSRMFQSLGVKSIIVGQKWNTANVSESTNMFIYCLKIVGEKGTVYDSSHTDKTYARIDGGESAPGYLSTIQDITQKTITLDNETFVYTGEAIEPIVTVEGLTEGQDYIVDYADNTDVGTAKVIITGKGIYQGTVEKSFAITAQSIADKTVSIEGTSFTYTGNAIEPEVTIEGLVEETDYLVSYSNNVNVGTAIIEITGKGNYTGTVEKTFDIDSRTITDADVTLSQTSYTYTGSAITPGVSVAGLKKDTDYSIGYSNNIAAGTASVIVTGINNCTGTVKKTFTINTRAIKASEVKLSGTKFEYTGSEIKPAVTVGKFEEDVDYTVEYTDNINIGTASVTITGINSCTGTITKKFSIYAHDITVKEVILEGSEFQYTGSEIRPSVTIEGLVEGTDYTADYTNNIDPGTAGITITGIGIYEGTIEKSFTIKINDIIGDLITLEQTTYNYSGEENRPKVSIEGLEEGKDFDVEYRNNINAGEATVVITGKGLYTGATAAKAFTILPIVIVEQAVSLEQETFEYNGSSFSPAITVDNLQEGVDFSVAYSNNTNVGNATVKVVGMGNYTGTVTKKFRITVHTITDNEVILEQSQYTYTRKPITPTVTIQGLKKTDYTISSYNNNIDAGTATVTVVGKGNCDGTVTKTFTISPKELNSGYFSIDPSSVEYTGDEIKPNVGTLSYIEENRDYTVSYSNNINVGTATVTIVCIGNYCGTVKKTFKITMRTIKESDVTWDLSSTEYTGEEIKPGVSVDGLKEDVDYTVSYSNNIDAGTGTVAVTGINNCDGVISKTFTIAQQDISGKTITIKKDVYTFTGQAISPKTTIAGLEEGKDFTVSYQNNTEAGTATITVTAQGNYTGTNTIEFEIQRADISRSKISLSHTKYVYAGKAIQPSVTITTPDGVVLNNTDYDVKYANNTGIGTAKVTVTGKGNYKGTLAASFLIKPGKASIKKVAPLYQQATVTVQGVKGNASYQIQYKPAGGKWKSIRIGTSKTKTFKKLKNRKYYYFRTRAFKKVNGKTYYGEWSKSKKTQIGIPISKCKISGVKDQVYTGKNLYQKKVKVTYKGKKATFKIKYGSHKTIGEHCVSIVGTGKYIGTVYKYYDIYPGKATMSGFRSYNWYADDYYSFWIGGVEYDPDYEYYDSDDMLYMKKVSLKCKSQKGNVKYQFAFKWEGGSWDYYNSGKDRSVYWYDIPKNKTVYAKVRAYKVVGEWTYYGEWSAVTKESTANKSIKAKAYYSSSSKYVQGTVKGAFKGEKVVVKVGKKTYTQKITKNGTFKFKIKVGKIKPGKKITYKLRTKFNQNIGTYSDIAWYAKKVKVGMTKTQVRYTWGTPSRKTSASGGWDLWYWGDGSYVYFKNGKVKYWYNGSN